MGLLSRFTSRDSAPDAAPLWRRAPFVSTAAGDEVAVTYRRGEPPLVVPLFVVDFVLGCEKFRPLETHLATHAEMHGWSRMQVASLQSWLPQLQSAGLLVSSAALHAKCKSATAAPRANAGIESIGFPTGGNRAALMARALGSFIANTRTHGRSAEFLIADSSTDPAHSDAFRKLAHESGARVRYSGDGEKKRFATQLVKRSGCSPEAVEFALFDPLATGFSCGANRNALLLHGAGRMLCSVDDDVICRIAPPAQESDTLALYATCDPFTRRLFASPDAAREAAHFAEVDFLGMHEAMLGHGLAALMPDDPAAFDVSQANDEILRRIDDAAPRVRATFCGHVGDPGIPTTAYFLYFDGENLDRLTASEAHYRSVFTSRSVLTQVAHRAIGDASVCPGMAMGLDHRDLLPPFFPVLHAEDFIFGATLWKCCPDAVLGHLPPAIAHEPPAGKAILQPSDFHAARRAVVFEFAHLVRRLVLNFPPAPRDDATQRMHALGRSLAESGRIPRDDFRDFLRLETLHHESARLLFLEQQLREHSDAPAYWRDDVQALIDHARESLAFDDFDIPFDLKAARPPGENRALMQTLIARFGALLQEWPAMVATARTLREEGSELFAT